MISSMSVEQQSISKTPKIMTLHYHSTSKFKELITNHLSSGNIAADDNIAAHVVTAILYGADACFVFYREVSTDEDKQKKNS